MSLKKRIIAFSMAALAALALMACGTDKDKEAETAMPPETVESEVTPETTQPADPVAEQPTQEAEQPAAPAETTLAEEPAPPADETTDGGSSDVEGEDAGTEQPADDGSAEETDAD